MRMCISDKLRQAMQSKGFSQYALAERSGVPQPTIQRILSKETVSPKLSTIEKLAKAMQINPAELMGSASGSLIKFEQNVVGVQEPTHIYPKGGLSNISEAINNCIYLTPEAHKTINAILTAADEKALDDRDWVLIRNMFKTIMESKHP